VTPSPQRRRCPTNGRVPSAAVRQRLSLVTVTARSVAVTVAPQSDTRDAVADGVCRGRTGVVVTPAEQVFSSWPSAHNARASADRRRLPAALAAAPPGTDLVALAVQHGLAPLLLAHIRTAKAMVAPSVSVRLYAQQAHHVRIGAVRRRVVAETVEALTEANIPCSCSKAPRSRSSSTPRPRAARCETSISSFAEPMPARVRDPYASRIHAE